MHTNTLTNEDFKFYEKVFAECSVVSWNEWLMLSPVQAGEFHRLREYMMAVIKYYLVKLRNKGK